MLAILGLGVRQHCQFLALHFLLSIIWNELIKTGEVAISAESLAI
jgi:hypothetical protein